MNQVPKKSITIKLKENSYEISFPTTGEYIAIQNLKSSLASNYDTLNVDAESQWAKTLVNVSAHFMILCPKMIEDLTKPIMELSMIESMEIVKVYTEQFRDWYNEGLNFVFKANKQNDN